MVTKQSKNKTQPTSADPLAFIASIEHRQRREDAQVLLEMFSQLTGARPIMWGSIVGFGQYHYVYESGREGDCIATGFSPRKLSISLYIMPGFKDVSSILSRLGKHKLGKACLYVNKLSDIDMEALAELIVAGLIDLNKKWPVQGLDISKLPDYK